MQILKEDESPTPARFVFLFVFGRKIGGICRQRRKLFAPDFFCCNQNIMSCFVQSGAQFCAYRRPCRCLSLLRPKCSLFERLKRSLSAAACVCTFCLLLVCSECRFFCSYRICSLSAPRALTCSSSCTLHFFYRGFCS